MSEIDPTFHKPRDLAGGCTARLVDREPVNAPPPDDQKRESRPEDLSQGLSRAHREDPRQPHLPQARPTTP